MKKEGFERNRVRSDSKECFGDGSFSLYQDDLSGH